MTIVPLGQIPAHNAQRFGEQRWGLRHGDELLGWGELDRRSTRRARALAIEGVGQDDLVMIALPNGNALFELAFAVWKLGATPAIVSANLPAPELAAILDLAQPKLVVADSAAGAARPGAMPGDFGLDHADDRPFEPRVARYWKVMASGGSTGRPKLIVARQPAAMDARIELLRQPRDTVILNPGPCHHNMPFTTSVLGMLRGCAISGMVRFGALEALRLMARDRVAWVNLVPTMMARIWSLPREQREGFDLSSLRTVLHTAAPTPEWLKRAWIDWLGPDRIWEVYGGTEGVGITMIGGAEWLARPRSVGRAVGCAVRVLDAAGQPLPPGELGNIFFASSPATGTPFHYIGAEAELGPAGSVSLGDRGWLDDQGYLYIAGRRTDLILSGGENIYPAEIEDALSSCAGVAAVVVIGLPDDDLGERVHALIEPLDPARPPSEALLRATVEARLERRKCPRSYEIVPGPLRDAAGKVRRGALRDERIAPAL